MTYYPSINERLKTLLTEMDGCASCGGMGVGDGGFSSDSPAEGPTAGYDPVMGKVKRRRKKRSGVNEGKKPLPDFKMILKDYRK